MSTRGSIGLTLAAWLPLALIVALTAYLFATDSAPLRTLVHLMKHPYDAKAGFAGNALRVIALVSVAMGIVYMRHLFKNPAVTARAAWIMGFIFVASIVLPIYWVRYVHTGARPVAG